MKHLSVVLLSWVGLLLPNSAIAQFPEATASWGETVRGAKIGLSALTYLREGQPFEVVLRVVPPSENNGPFPQVLWDRPATVTLELTDGAVTRIPFRIDRRFDNVSLDRFDTRFRLWPTQVNDGKRYWKPGEYKLRATIDSPPADAFNTRRWGGTLVSNMLSIKIAPADSARKSPLNDPAFLRQAKQWADDFFDVDPAKRKAAEIEINKHGAWVRPLLYQNQTLSADDLSRLMPFERKLCPRLSYGAILAELDDQAWKSLGIKITSSEMDYYSVEAARYAPLLTLPEKEIVAMLEHKNPATRIRAIRSLPRLKDPIALRMLVKRLEDPFTQIGVAGCVFYSSSVVADEAREAIIFQGPQMIPYLIDFHAKRKKPKVGVMYPSAIEILGKLGPDKNAGRFMEQVLAKRNNHDQHQAVEAIAEWGPEGVPLMLKIVNNTKADPWVRQKALEGISEHGPKDQVAAILQKVLLGRNPDSLRVAAAWGIERHKLRNMLPDLERIAMAESVETSLRESALHAFVTLSDHGDAEKIVCHFLDPKHDRRLRCAAAYMTGRADHRKVVPLLLPMLDEPVTVIDHFDPRVAADHALRIIAKLPNGVGYEPARRNSETWRAWWAKHAQTP